MATPTQLTPLEALTEVRKLADTLLTQYQTSIQRNYEGRLESLQREHEDQMRAAQENFDQTEFRAKQHITTTLDRLKYTAASWVPAQWSDYPSKMADNALNGSLRAGVLPQSFPQFGVEQLPMLIPVLDVGHIVITSQGAAKVKARAILQSLGARAVLQLARSGTRFLFIDPIAVGANFPFPSLPYTVRGERIAVESDEIDQVMKLLTDTIRDGTAHPPLIVCAADFPVRWSHDALMRLETVASAGVANQVYAIIQMDTTRVQQDMDPLMNTASLIHVTDSEVTASVQGTSYTFEPDEQPPAPLLNTLLTALVSTLTP